MGYVILVGINFFFSFFFNSIFLNNFSKIKPSNCATSEKCLKLQKYDMNRPLISINYVESTSVEGSGHLADRL